MNVLYKVRQTIDRFDLLSPGQTVVVGVSGGPDSLCLLHVLHRLSEAYRIALHVAHLDHRMRGREAEEDAVFVADLAAQWGLPVTVEAYDVPALAREKKLSPEEAARQARYAFLAGVAGRLGAKSVAVGHNADDQTETIIMHWLRGSGLAGLRGMLPMTEVGALRLEVGELETVPPSLRIIRPLLEVTRGEIEAYCREEGLQPRFDRSNLDITYYRNRLRHELIPYLESYNPKIREVVRRSAQLIADDYDHLRAELARAWPQVVMMESEAAIRFDLTGWRALSTGLQRSALREAIHRLRHSLRNINWIHVEDALRALQTKPAGTQVTLPQGLMLTIGYEDFTVADVDYGGPLPDWPFLSVECLEVSVPGRTVLPGSNWCLEAELLNRRDVPEGDLVDNDDPWQAFLDHGLVGAELALRRRQPGDRFQPLGMGGHWKLMRAFMIDVKIPSRWREGVPILVCPQGIVWVAGWRIDERFKVGEETERILHLKFVPN